MPRRRRTRPWDGCLPLAALLLLSIGALALSWHIAHTQERPSYLPPPQYTDPRTMREPQGRSRDAPRLNPSQASRARAQAEAERAAQTAQEYYAEDWIVVGPDGTVVCKDPYVRLAHKYIECISSEPVR